MRVVVLNIRLGIADTRLLAVNTHKVLLKNMASFLAEFELFGE